MVWWVSGSLSLRTQPIHHSAAICLSHPFPLDGRGALKEGPRRLSGLKMPQPSAQCPHHRPSTRAESSQAPPCLQRGDRSLDRSSLRARFTQDSSGEDLKVSGKPRPREWGAWSGHGIHKLFLRWPHPQNTVRSSPVSPRRGISRTECHCL